MENIEKIIVFWLFTIELNTRLNTSYVDSLSEMCVTKRT